MGTRSGSLQTLPTYLLCHPTCKMWISCYLQNADIRIPPVCGGILLFCLHTSAIAGRSSVDNSDMCMAYLLQWVFVLITACKPLPGLKSYTCWYCCTVQNICGLYLFIGFLIAVVYTSYPHRQETELCYHLMAKLPCICAMERSIDPELLCSTSSAMYQHRQMKELL